ncbi:MAG TPA: ATP-binding protein [Vicinamibacterales bacterium]
MEWLLSGAIYSALYVLAGAVLQRFPGWLLWFRLVALLLPPLTGVFVIVRRRRAWRGCEWLFWATVSLGLVMSAVGLLGWTFEAVFLSRNVSWLGWYQVFALFGTITPLFALLAQPHRGARERLMATTAVDIAGIAVMTGFLYSRFVISADAVNGAMLLPKPLVILSEFQQIVVYGGMTLAAWVARDGAWGRVYRRLSLGFLVNLVIITIGHAEIWQGLYRPGEVYDVVWILPFAFYPWAASASPDSAPDTIDEPVSDPEPSRPWVVFGAIALIPVIDLALRPALPLGIYEGHRDLFTVVTVMSVLPLLIARLAVERDEARAAEGKRRLLSAAIEHADHLVLITTPDGKVEHANSAFCQALGYERADIARMPITRFFASESRGNLDDLKATAGTGDVWRGTLVHQRRDRSQFPAATVVVPLALNNQVSHLVGVGHDLTADLQMRDQLIHSERLAATGELVAGVAHELNNPLQAILGFTELIMQEQKDEHTLADLANVKEQAERAATIVRNLLTFVRRSPVTREMIDLNELVRRTLSLRAYELHGAGIAVDERYADDLPRLMVNRGEIQQIVVNLILNAEQAIRSATRRGSIVVQTSRDGNAAAIDVQDDGPGVPAAVARKIFEPFFSTKNVGEGTGLGLSIALGIARAHGGSLALVPSTTGAHFRLTLPIGERSTGDARAAEAAALHAPA